MRSLVFLGMCCPAGELFRTREIVVGENPLTFASSRMVIITGWSVRLDRVSSISKLSLNKLALKGERFRREALTKSFAKTVESSSLPTPAVHMTFIRGWQAE